MHQPVDQLEISLRAQHSLQRLGLLYVGDLANMDDEKLLGKPRVGQVTIEEIRMALASHGLSFPFSLEEGSQVPWEYKQSMAVEFLAESTQPEVTRPGESEQSTDRDAIADEQRWVAHVVHRLQAAPQADDALRLLQEIFSFTLEHHNDLEHRLSQLIQLQGIGLELTAELNDNKHDCWIAQRLWQLLLARYSADLEGTDYLRNWMFRLQKGLGSAGALSAFVLRCRGASLKEIGQCLTPSRTAERIRQMIGPIELVLGRRGLELSQEWQELLHAQRGQSEQTLGHLWVSQIGRLPFHTDDPEIWNVPDHPNASSVADELANLKLVQRLHRYGHLGIQVPEAEWNLHCRVIANREERPGEGYWDSPEALNQFLQRYAVVIGKPGFMPKQKQLPACVSAAVQRHGGQFVLTQTVGLRYQGQLVADDGSRTYWTNQRLRDCLAMAAEFHQLTPDQMPSRVQIRDFLQNGPVEEYRNKHPESVYSALTRQNTLKWPDVAVLFGRRDVIRSHS